jgi:formylglycine-generating enzyme required for sulfatase activity
LYPTAEHLANDIQVATLSELIAMVSIKRTELPDDGSALKPSERRVLTMEGIEFAFRWIPPTTARAGKFKMETAASESGHQSDENQVDVTLTQGFWMLETEVTQAMYFSVTKAKPWQGKDYVKEGVAFPACYVSWKDASDFGERLTIAARRANVLSTKEKIALPTEAQWEWAARAGTTAAYVSGNDDSKLGDFAWYDKNAWDVDEKYAHQVGLKKANDWGLLDISGNLWEWCSDYYVSTFPVSTFPVSTFPGGTNPTGPLAGSSRVLRGASFYSSASYVRIGYRNCDVPTRIRNLIGFRVVCVSESAELSVPVSVFSDLCPLLSLKGSGGFPLLERKFMTVPTTPLFVKCHDFNVWLFNESHAKASQKLTSYVDSTS